MDRIVECVPNFSEGKDQKIISAIAAAIESVEGVTLLDVDPGADTNRTVVTFVGSPEPIQEAAFQAIKKAAELIDMRHHKGAHARLGATDVCPFVPVAGVTMADCVRIARAVAERVATELEIPIYLYEAAAANPQRRNLANIRQGEYEGLAEKLQDPDWAPDFGTAKFNPRSGATVIGAREFLIAYNVNLNTRDRKLAHEIALNIREAGRAQRDSNGEIVRDANGVAINVPGAFQEVKAVGWYIDTYQRAQISINLTNYQISPPHLVFDEIRRQADRYGLRVTGSEVVGLIPLQAMLDAGQYFLRKQGKSTGVPESDLVRMAILSMGLSDVAPFDPGQKIIEYRVRKRSGPLVSRTVSSFADELSTDSPAPGGGSVAALAGALAAALAAMVANLTFGKKEYHTHWSELEQAAVKAQEYKDAMLSAVDEDTRAFNHLMATFGLPKKTDEQKAIRSQAIEQATIRATLVPLGVVQNALEILALIKIVAEKGNINAVSDAGVGASMARGAAEGAALNVFINLKNISDQQLVAQYRTQAQTILSECQSQAAQVLEIVSKKISG